MPEGCDNFRQFGRAELRASVTFFQHHKKGPEDPGRKLVSGNEGDWLRGRDLNPRPSGYECFYLVAVQQLVFLNVLICAGLFRRA